MKIFIPKEVIGSNFNLICNETGNVKKSSTADNINHDTISSVSNEANEIAKLYNFSLPKFPPKEYVKAYKAILGQKYHANNIPWKACIPKTAYQKELKLYVNSFQSALNQDLSYYQKYYKPTKILLDNLSPAYINVNRYQKFLLEDKNTINKFALKTFTPIKTWQTERGILGKTDIPVYSRTNSKTGRITVIKGPNILTLKKDFRSILTSRWEDGSIYYLDYKSLEPRVLLFVKGVTNIPKDPYEDLLAINGLSERIPRKAAKIVVNSITNGAGEKTIKKQLKGIVDYPEDFIQLVRDYFGINDLRQRLITEYSKNHGKLIKNFYGRPIHCEETQPYVLLNYFIQSTAVDVSLLGFTKIYRKLMKSNLIDYCVPILVLHDALIVDVHPKIEHMLRKLVKFGETVPKFDNNKFWLEIEKIEDAHGKI